ncbi:MAG TPA: hypothetical protein VFH26_03775 [Gemmatimonadales bacterium]|nr:hypothetical protein [Gemmatimonadales bacterium]
MNCARFAESIESKILTEAGGRIRRQTSSRRGSWQFRAVDAKSGLVLEAWLDSLVITRRSEETAISPDTEGLLGGRYRGTLSRTGAYAARARPFVPDEVAEVAGMASALDDMFPRLAPRALHIGELWTDSLELTVRRLADSVSSGTPLLRFELRRRGESQAAASGHDSVPLEVQQKSDEVGQVVWHPGRGLLRSQRNVVVETTVPPSRTVRQAVRSKVEQRLTLTRTSDAPVCRS